MRRYLAALALIGLTFWLYGFSVSLYAGRCRQPHIPPQDRVGICRNARQLSGWLMTDAQLSGFFRNEGLALSELGRHTEAAAAFAEAERLTSAP